VSNRIGAVWISADGVPLAANGVLNRIHEADVAEIPALRLNCRIRFRTPLSDKVVRKRRHGGMVAFGQIGMSDASATYKYQRFRSLPP
jgi:hypothetical protein